VKLNRKNLLIAIANAGINDHDLCLMSGVSRPALTKIKACRNNPKPVTIGRLARALNVSVEYLTQEAANE